MITEAVNHIFEHHIKQEFNKIPIEKFDEYIRKVADEKKSQSALWNSHLNQVRCSIERIAQSNGVDHDNLSGVVDRVLFRYATYIDECSAAIST